MIEQPKFEKEEEIIKGAGLIKDFIRAEEGNALYFKTLQDEKGEKIATSSRSRPISKIVGVERGKEE